jgi:hypothetical protein
MAEEVFRLASHNADSVPGGIKLKIPLKNRSIRAQARGRVSFSASPRRTSFKPCVGFRTRTVRLFGVMTATLGAFAVLGAAAAAEPPTVAREARGWLQLEHSQQVYRERVEPLTPAEELTLERIERGQDLDLRGLQQHQQRGGREQERRQRFTMPDRPAPVPRPGATLRESHRERLDLRIEQETLRGGRF